MLKTCAANQLDGSQNQEISDERDRCRQRTGIHCKKAETTVRRAHDIGHRTSAHRPTFLKVVWMVQEAEEGQETTGGRCKRLDWQDSGGMHDNSKRQKKLETTGASFRGLRRLAMKMENEDYDDDNSNVRVLLIW